MTRNEGRPERSGRGSRASRVAAPQPTRAKCARKRGCRRLRCAEGSGSRGAPTYRRDLARAWTASGLASVRDRAGDRRAAPRSSFETGARPTLAGVPRAVRSTARRHRRRLPVARMRMTRGEREELDFRKCASVDGHAARAGAAEDATRHGRDSPWTRRGALAARKCGVTANDACMCSGLRGRIAVGWYSENEHGLHAR